MEEANIKTYNIDSHKQNRRRKRDYKRHKNKPITDDCNDFKSEMSLSDKRNTRLERYRSHMAEVRLNETPEQHTARLERARIRAAKVRNAETPEERLARLERARKYKTELRINETPEQRSRRLESARRHMSEMRLNETPEHRAMRLARTRIYNQVARRNETLERRNARLASARRYMSKIRKNRTVNVTGQEHCIKLGTPNQKPDTLDREFSQKFDNKSIDCLPEGIEIENLSAHVEICLEDDVDYKKVDYQIQDKAKNNVKEIVNIFISKPNLNNNNDDNDSADVINESIYEPEITKPAEVLPMTYNVQYYDDIQLNSITSNILPLDQEVKRVLEMKNNRVNQQNKYACPKCDKIYRYAHSLKKHLNVHDTIE